MNSRLEQLQKFYEEDPNDPFNLYALALEYQKIDSEKAMCFYDVLLAQHPEYLPVYYHAAKFYQDVDNREMAISLYEKGIALAKKTNELKTLRELQSAYQELLFE